MIKLSFAKEQLISKEFTSYTITTSETSLWKTNRIFTTCVNDGFVDFNFVDYSGRQYFGVFGEGEIAAKTFPGLPPHWSLSLRMDVLLYSSVDLDDYIEVKINSVAYGHYTKKSSEGHLICTDDGGFFVTYYDELVFFNQNLTHSASSVEISMLVQTDEGISNEGGAIRNLFLFVDTCDISCNSCNGPTATQCLTCPSNSDQSGNTCTCKSGYFSHLYTCVPACPSGYVQSNSSNICIINPCATNCSVCN